MKNFKGLGTALEAEVVKRTYDDGIKTPLRELGALTAEVVRTGRLLWNPANVLLTLANERLASWATAINARVPAEHRQEVDSYLAGPALSAMVFIPDDNPLMTMFLNLLTCAMDRRVSHAAHPAFVKMIEHLHPDEAMILLLLKDKLYFSCLGPPNSWKVNTGQSWLLRDSDCGEVPTDRYWFNSDLLTHDASIYIYLEHLESMNLLERCKQSDLFDRIYRQSLFGKAFMDVCVPDDSEELWKAKGLSSDGATTYRADWQWI